MSDKIKELEEEYKNVENALPRLDLSDTPISNISEFTCASCGARLTTAEWKEFEDTCEECMHMDTAGLIDDGDYEELDFDDAP